MKHLLLVFLLLGSMSTQAIHLAALHESFENARLRKHAKEQEKERIEKEIKDVLYKTNSKEEFRTFLGEVISPNKENANKVMSYISGDEDIKRMVFGKLFSFFSHEEIINILGEHKDMSISNNLLVSILDEAFERDEIIDFLEVLKKSMKKGTFKGNALSVFKAINSFINDKYSNRYRYNPDLKDNIFKSLQSLSSAEGLTKNQLRRLIAPLYNEGILPVVKIMDDNSYLFDRETKARQYMDEIKAEFVYRTIIKEEGTYHLHSLAKYSDFSVEIVLAQHIKNKDEFLKLLDFFTSREIGLRTYVFFGKRASELGITPEEILSYEQKFMKVFEPKWMERDYKYAQKKFGEFLLGIKEGYSRPIDLLTLYKKYTQMIEVSEDNYRNYYLMKFWDEATIQRLQNEGATIDDFRSIMSSLDKVEDIDKFVRYILTLKNWTAEEKVKITDYTVNRPSEAYVKSRKRLLWQLTFEEGFIKEASTETLLEILGFDFTNYKVLDDLVSRTTSVKNALENLSKIDISKNSQYFVYKLLKNKNIVTNPEDLVVLLENLAPKVTSDELKSFMRDQLNRFHKNNYSTDQFNRLMELLENSDKIEIAYRLRSEIGAFKYLVENVLSDNSIKLTHEDQDKIVKSAQKYQGYALRAEKEFLQEGFFKDLGLEAQSCQNIIIELMR